MASDTVYSNGTATTYNNGKAVSTAPDTLNKPVAVSPPNVGPNSGANQGAAGGVNPQDLSAYQAAAASGVPLSEAGNVAAAAKALAASGPAANTQGAYAASAPATSGAAQASAISQGQGTNVNNSGYGSGTSYDGSDQPLTEDQVYQQMLGQSQGIIDSIQSSYDSEIASNTEAEEQVGGQAQQDQNAMAAASGLLGSSAAVEGANKVNSDTQTNIQSANAPIVAQKAQAVAGAMQTIQSNAMSQYQTDVAQQQQVLQNAQDAVKTMAEAGVNWSAFQGTPQYQQLVDQLGGDPNYADALFTMSQPVGTVDPNLSKVIGDTYYQVTKNPVTGALSSSQFTLPYTPPTNWTAQKVSTTTLLMQDPNNAANSILYTTDPVSGQVQVSGTGTGSQLASAYNSSATGTSGTTGGNSTAATGAVATDYINTATSTAGITDPTQLFSAAVNGDGTSTNPGVGIGSLVAGVVAAEGGSPARVENNPGNVLYVPGMAGATDSGVHPTDNPTATFANFDTQTAGENASAKSLTDIAASLGPNATVQDVLDQYANLGDTSSAVSQGPVGSSGLPLSQYGALANVPDFNPNSTTDAGVTDSMAYNYLTEYLSGQTPSTSSLGISLRQGGGAQFDKAAQRAKTLYNQATGQNLPNQTELKANLGFINGNNALLNSLKVQEGTIQANSDLMQGNINAQNINKNAPVINNVIDGIANAMGNPDVASYLAQNSTLSNELGSLLALKNASGTTVHDKLISADLISPDASAEQEAKVVNTLMQEAGNAHTAISLANAKLYQATDPLGLDPQNPLSNPTQFAQEIGLNLSAIQKDYPSMTPEEILTQYINSQ